MSVFTWLLLRSSLCLWCCTLMCINPYLDLFIPLGPNFYVMNLRTHVLFSVWKMISFIIWNIASTFSALFLLQLWLDLFYTSSFYLLCILTYLSCVQFLSLHATFCRLSLAQMGQKFKAFQITQIVRHHYKMVGCGYKILGEIVFPSTWLQVCMLSFPVRWVYF